VGRVLRGGQAGVPRGRVRPSAPRLDGEAVTRLGEELHTLIEERRRALGVELTVIEALIRMGALDAAAHALEDQHRALRALGRQLKEVIGNAAAEQAAERALDVWRGLPVTASAGLSRGRAGRGPSSRPRLALAAAMIGLVLVPSLWEPLQVFSAREVHESREERAAWSEIHAARERLATYEPTQADAEKVAAEARAVHDRILSLPDSALASKTLRAEIRGLLAEQSGTLRDLQGNPDAKSLLAEVHALSASLGLGLPESRVKPPEPADNVRPLPALEQAPPQRPKPKPEPEKPVPDLTLPKQPAPERPDPGSLGVHQGDQRSRSYRPDLPNPKPNLQP
jgi:hypothetical protein